MFCPLCAYANGLIVVEVDDVLCLVGVTGGRGAGGSSHWRGSILASGSRGIDEYLRLLAHDTTCGHQTVRAGSMITAMIQGEPGYGRHD